MKQVSRFERKFILPLEEYYRFRNRVELLMPKDPHTGQDGYRIRSLYFDTLWDRDYFEKMDGVELRRKLRLRIYDTAADFALLEMKQKQGDHQRKRSLRITREDAEAIAAGDFTPLRAYQGDFAAECIALLNMCAYQPKSIIEYIREAYTAPENDIRVTFDRDIRATEGNMDIFAPDLPLYPVMDCGQVVLEVKYNGFLVEYVRELVDAFHRSQTSASKYCMGRLVSYGNY